MTFTAYTYRHRAMLHHYLGNEADVEAFTSDHAPNFPGCYIKQGETVIWRDRSLDCPIRIVRKVESRRAA